ncbi:hypothetical protein V6N13_083180 [Hibiscus sabdariffa]
MNNPYVYVRGRPISYRIGWTRKEYMKRMNMTKVVLENFAMPPNDDEIPTEHAVPDDPEPNQAQATEAEPAQPTTIDQQLIRVEN